MYVTPPPVSEHAEYGDFFDPPQLVVRRGSSFFMWADGEPSFSFAPCGTVHALLHTAHRCATGTAPVPVHWQYRQPSGRQRLPVAGANVEVHVPADAPVGVYHVVFQGGEGHELFVIFRAEEYNELGGENPQALQQYAFGTKTMIWQGDVAEHTGNVWDLDPFNTRTLAAVMHMLQDLPLWARQEVATVARQLTFAMGRDVCYGEWDNIRLRGRPPGGYTCSTAKSQWFRRCRAPGYWTGSTELYEHYLGLLLSGSQATNVQYCQCFVFAAVMTTAARSLGIPARVVTTFNSAHDTNADRAISMFYHISPDGTWYESETHERPDEDSHGGGEGDSIWGFHVWTEMWMGRRDHGASSGWQITDGTPQEKSHGEFMCGPASLADVSANTGDTESQDGATIVGYDGCYDNEFVIAEVNADLMCYGRPEGASFDDDWVPSEYMSDDSGEQWPMRYHTDPFGDANVGALIVTTDWRCGDGQLYALDGGPADACMHELTWDYKTQGHAASPGWGTEVEEQPQCRSIHTPGGDVLGVYDGDEGDMDMFLLDEGEGDKGNKGEGDKGKSDGRGNARNAGVQRRQLRRRHSTGQSAALQAKARRPSKAKAQAEAKDGGEVQRRFEGFRRVQRGESDVAFTVTFPADKRVVASRTVRVRVGVTSKADEARTIKWRLDVAINDYRGRRITVDSASSEDDDASEENAATATTATTTTQAKDVVGAKRTSTSGTDFFALPDPSKRGSLDLAPRDATSSFQRDVVLDASTLRQARARAGGAPIFVKFSVSAYVEETSDLLIRHATRRVRVISLKGVASAVLATNKQGAVAAAGRKTKTRPGKEEVAGGVGLGSGGGGGGGGKENKERR